MLSNQTAPEVSLAAFGSGSRFVLFRHLHDDAFLAFSREHKHLYAACLLDLYERFFTGAPSFPTPQEVTHAIYDVMGANPSLWNESDDFGEPLPEMVSTGRRRMKRAATNKTEAGNKALSIARQLYGRLIVWGWLEEEEYDRVRIERQVRQELGEYFDKFGVVSQVGTESEPLREVKPWMDMLIQEMETSELRRYERQAREAADKAATLLRGEFINALTSRISKMERELSAMNRGLTDHPFHNERYSFHHTRLAEFQPILKIIEISKTSPEALDMLFKGGEVPDDFPHRDTLREIEALLEDPDKDFSEFEDYRNFFSFEIHMQDVVTGRTTRWETRRGTGSGAEQQVPIYVAIGASLASVYGSADGGSGNRSGMSLAIFDEAFSKLDGKNQRQMMSFYKKLGLQIIIAAPNEKRVAVLEHIDTVVEVDRIGESARATVVHLKERARKELRAMDPDLMSDADLKRLAAE